VCVGNELTSVLPEVLEPVAGKADDKQPRCAGDRCGGDDDEHAGDADFDGENGAAPVGDRETDVDGGDHHKPERVDSRRVEPPERSGVAACATPITSPQTTGAHNSARSGCDSAATLMTPCERSAARVDGQVK
jgi:hypothetical protein